MRQVGQRLRFRPSCALATLALHGANAVTLSSTRATRVCLPTKRKPRSWSEKCLASGLVHAQPTDRSEISRFLLQRGASREPPADARRLGRLVYGRSGPKKPTWSPFNRHREPAIQGTMQNQVLDLPAGHVCVPEQLLHRVEVTAAVATCGYGWQHRGDL
jgi:hypothetical protein